MSWLSTSGGQRIGASASASVLPMNIHGWFPLGLTGCLLAVQRTLKSLLQHHSSKASILQHSAFFMVQLSHPYMTTGKTIALTRWTFVSKSPYSNWLYSNEELECSLYNHSTQLSNARNLTPMPYFYLLYYPYSNCVSLAVMSFIALLDISSTAGSYTALSCQNSLCSELR